MDVRMPQKDGLTALDELKQKSDTRQIPVVMLSASLVDREKALDAGASYFLSKPYEGHELIKAVNAAIDQAEEDELPGSTYATPNMKVKYSYD